MDIPKVIKKDLQSDSTTKLSDSDLKSTKLFNDDFDIDNTINSLLNQYGY